MLVFCFWKLILLYLFFFFQAEDGIRDVAVTGVQTCALPIFGSTDPSGILDELLRPGCGTGEPGFSERPGQPEPAAGAVHRQVQDAGRHPAVFGQRSEEHTSELQSRLHLVCRLLLEKKKNKNHSNTTETDSVLYHTCHTVVVHEQHVG